MTSKRSKENSTQQSKRVCSTNNTVKNDPADSDESTVTETSQFPISQIQSEVGIIESISLKNFMCHSLLEFKFGNNVNFINGRNGSGKSAILTATVVGLGGRAMATNRGSSVKDFIKNGKSNAEIAITLRNVGKDAYKSEVYGNSIVVERQLSSDGSSKYKLKSQNNRIVSIKKEELVHILDHFNIQVDNPLCILNQDLSREFLQIESPKTMYKLFLKATQLGQMKEDYDSINKKKSDAESILRDKKKAILELKKEESHWKTRLDHHASLDKQRDKRDKLLRESAWAQIKGIEEEWGIDQRKLNELQSQMPKFIQKVEEYKEKLKISRERHKEVDSKMKTLSNEIKEYRPKCEELRKLLAEKKNIQRRVTFECQKIAAHIKSIEKDRNSLLTRIEELKKGDADDHSIEKQKRQERIQVLETSRLELQAAYETKELHCRQLCSAIMQYNDRIKSKKQEEDSVKKDIESLTRKIKELESSRSNYIKRFGPWVPEALRLITEAYNRKEFKQKPRGPVGAYVKLHDPKWNLAVENCLKPLLFAFCCDNYDDQKVLENLLGRVIRQNNGRMPSIITGRFNNRVHDVSAYRVWSSKYTSMLDMLQISDPVITNLLIDQRRIESILLIENSSEARRVMTREVPKNCMEAFTCAGDQLYPSPKFRVYSSQNDKAVLLQESVADVIRNLQQECDNLQRQQRDVNSQLTALNQECSSNLMESKNVDSSLARMQQQMLENNSELNELKSIVDPEPVYVTSLEEDLQELSNQYESLKQESKLILDRYKACKEDTTATAQEYQAIDLKLTSLMTEELNPLKEVFADIDREQELIKANLQHYENQKNAQEEKIENLCLTCSTKKDELDDYTRKTEEKFGPCLERVRSPDRISSEIEQIEKILKTSQDIHGSKEEVTIKYLQVKNRNEKVTQDVDNLEKFIKILNSMMIKRQKYFKHLCTYIGVRVKNFFTTALKLRMFHGDIQFNHSAETLKILFHGKKDNDQATSVRGLSGGERSFSTVSFILALWDTIESPFRMMDEFDVFMDLVNRRFSMKMLIDSATAKQFNQFIFLTPRDISFIEATNNIRIFRMKDPERNQGILPFHPVQNQQESESEG